MLDMAWRTRYIFCRETMEGMMGGQIVFGSVCLGLVAAVASHAAEPAGDKEAGGPQMLLCVDTVTETGAGGKTVYGYIDGKKTECMPEYEFLELYNRRRFEKDSAGRAEAEKTAREATDKDDGDIVKAILRGKKDLEGADLKEQDLMGLDFEGADLRNANLESADLRNANLEGANLEGASLKAAYLRKANLQGVRLAGADLRGAYLASADLTGLSGIAVEDLEKVTTLYQAKLDSALLAEVKEEMPKKLEKPKKCWEQNRWIGKVECEDEE
jgi:hypothetical protein